MARDERADLERLNEIDRLLPAAIDSLYHLARLSIQMQEICAGSNVIRNELDKILQHIHVLIGEYEALVGEVSRYRRDLERIADTLDHSFSALEGCSGGSKDSARIERERKINDCTESKSDEIERIERKRSEVERIERELEAQERIESERKARERIESERKARERIESTLSTSGAPQRRNPGASALAAAQDILSAGIGSIAGSIAGAVAPSIGIGGVLGPLFGRKSEKKATSARPVQEKAEAAVPDFRSAEFSAIAPKSFEPGGYSMIDVVMYEESFRHIVDDLIAQADEPVGEKRSGVHKAAVGSRIRVHLTSPDVAIEDSDEEQVWNGGYLSFSFAVSLPENYTKPQILFIASVYVDGVLLCRLKFDARRKSDRKQALSIIREDIMSAFISYASQDRHRVATILQGMKKVRPEMDIFFDVDSLRSGDDWETALQREIHNRDVLYLCWSRNAKASQWVEAEWRYALHEKGLSGIEPVPIESPAVCPPPDELKSKHFNDVLLYIINASERKNDP